MRVKARRCNADLLILDTWRAADDKSVARPVACVAIPRGSVGLVHRTC